MRYVAEELIDPYSSFAGGVGAAAFEDFVIRTLLESATHNYTERLARAPSAATPHTVRRATAFMRENVFQPITVEDIAKATGCSARALAAAFRTQRERTVTSVLRDLRLDTAREAPRPETLLSKSATSPPASASAIPAALPGCIVSVSAKCLSRRGPRAPSFADPFILIPSS